MVERSALRTVDGQEFRVSTPARVFYPATRTTKNEVIDYYLAVADVTTPLVPLGTGPALPNVSPAATGVILVGRGSAKKCWQFT